MSQSATDRSAPLALAVPLGLFFAVFVLLPLVLLVWVSFYADSGMTQHGIKQYQRFLSDDFNRGVLMNTLWLGVKVTVVTLLLGLPLAYVYTLATPRWQGRASGTN